jgi:uncharacterized OsmC-like protein
VGEVELDGTVLAIRRIHVRYHLTVDPAKRDMAERVLGIHAGACPVARTLGGCIAITTELTTTDA